MREKLLRAIALAALLVGTWFVGFRAGHADGIPEPTPLRYSGTLEEGGLAVTGQRELAIRLWSHPDSTDATSHLKCTTPSQPVDVAAGHFYITLNEECAQAVHANANLWVEVAVGSTILPRSRLSAVPYSLQAARTSEATGALLQQITALQNDVRDLKSTLTFANSEHLGKSISKTQSEVDHGGCMEDLVHNWNTNAVGYAAWYSEPNGPGGQPTWVPVQPGYEPGTTNLALHKTASASSSRSSTDIQYTPAAAVDGQEEATAWASADVPTAWWQVDLGQLTTITRIRLHPMWNNSSGSSGSWDILLSENETFASNPVVSDVCTLPGNCWSWFDYALPTNTSARFIRFQSKTSVGSQPWATLSEFQVFSSTYTVSQPNPNSIRFCNYSGITRDLALVAWH